MKRIFYCIIACMHITMYSAGNSMSLITTFEIPELPACIETVKGATTEVQQTLTELQQSVTNNTETLAIKLQELNGTLQATLHTIQNTTQTFAPENISLCACGLTCVIGGVFALNKDSFTHQMLGAGLTIFGIILVLSSRQILDHING